MICPYCHDKMYALTTYNETLKIIAYHCSECKLVIYK